MRTLLIVRPEPGASHSAERARALGLDALVCPLFTVEGVAWTVPDPDRFDGLLLTSANALRFAGQGLEALASLSVAAVGEATAAAARAAGLTVSDVGTGDAATLLRSLPGQRRLLHLAGEHRGEIDAGHSLEAVTVYRAAASADPGLPAVAGMVVAVHSPRAGARLAELVTVRNSTLISAISEAAAKACGSGWEAASWPAVPNDGALLALAARLCQSPGR